MIMHDLFVATAMSRNHHNYVHCFFSAVYCQNLASHDLLAVVIGDYHMQGHMCNVTLTTDG